jgi:protein CpxP
MTLTRTSKTVVAVLAIVTLAVGSFAAAQTQQEERGRRGGFGRGFGGPHGPLGGLLRGLDVTDAQREQIRSIFEQYKDESRAIHERLGAAWQAQREAVQAIPPDEAQIRARSSELAAVQADAAVLRSRIHAAVFQVLTPEQQEKAKALQAERQKRGQELRQRWQERRRERQLEREKAQPPAPPAGQL